MDCSHIFVVIYVGIGRTTGAHMAIYVRNTHTLTKGIRYPRYTRSWRDIMAGGSEESEEAVDLAGAPQLFWGGAQPIGIHGARDDLNYDARAGQWVFACACLSWGGWGEGFWGGGCACDAMWSVSFALTMDGYML